METWSPKKFTTHHPTPPTPVDLKKIEYTPKENIPIYNPIKLLLTLIPQQSFNASICVTYTIDSSNNGPEVILFTTNEPIVLNEKIEVNLEYELDLTKLRDFSEHLLYNVAAITTRINDTSNNTMLSEYTSIVAVAKPDYGIDLTMTIYSPL